MYMYYRASVQDKVEWWFAISKCCVKKKYHSEEWIVNFGKDFSFL